MDFYKDLINTTIGEAAIRILMKKQPVSLDRLLTELHFMALSAGEESHKTACNEAISSLKSELTGEKFAAAPPKAARLLWQ